MGQRRYMQRLRVTRAGAAPPGVQDPDTGVFTPDPGNTADVIYDNRADVQDVNAVVRRGILGEPKPDTNAIVFLLGRYAVATIREGDLAVVTWDDPAHTQQSAEVNAVRRLDDTLELRYIGQAAVA